MWILEYTEKLNKVKIEVEEIEQKMKVKNLPVNFERVKEIAFKSILNK